MMLRVGPRDDGADYAHSILEQRASESGQSAAANGEGSATGILPSSRLGEGPGSHRLLFSNIAWMLSGNVSYGFSQWALLVTLAKLGTMDMVGSFALALAIGVPVLMFSSLSLRALQITDHNRSYRFLEYLTLRLLMIVLALVFILVFGVIAGYPAAVLASITLIGAAKAVEYISDILYGLLQQQEHMAGIGISMILRGVCSVGALSLGVYLTHSLVWGSIGLLVSSLLILLVYDIPKTVAVANTRIVPAMKECVKYVTQLISEGTHRRLRRLGMAGLPMGFVLMLVSLNLNIPRYFIQRNLGLRELAIFSAIATLMAAGSVVTSAIGQATAPRLAKCFASRDMRGFGVLLTAIVATSLGLGGLGLTGALLYGQQAMALIYRPEYSSRQDVLVWLMAASGFFYLGSTLGYAVTSVRCFAPQLPLFAVSAAATAISCVLLVPSQGLRGAAMAILISSVIQCLGSIGLLYKSYRAAVRASDPVADGLRAISPEVAT